MLGLLLVPVGKLHHPSTLSMMHKTACVHVHAEQGWEHGNSFAETLFCTLSDLFAH